MKYLNVAQNNATAKSIAALLSGNTYSWRDGFATFNKIYDFDIYEECVDMVMTSTCGHLLKYDFCDRYNWNERDPEKLFNAPFDEVCIDEDIKRTLEMEIQSCDGLIIWTNCDREGENIGFQIKKVCEGVKSKIMIHRAKFSEITFASVFKAFNNLEKLDEYMSKAVDVRKEIDLRIGAAFTRLQTLGLQREFPQKLADSILTYGTCQFPTLGFVVNRCNAIQQFEQKPFWQIKMNHIIGDLTIDYNWERNRLCDENTCRARLSYCQTIQVATVENVKRDKIKKCRPLPLTTVEMEKNISEKLNISAKDALNSAQKLYNDGLISYYRTETNFFPEEFDLVPLVIKQTQDERWGQFAQRIIADGPKPHQGYQSDQAQLPIYPIRYIPARYIPDRNDQKVYEYIVRHFLASLSEDAKGVEITIEVAIGEEKFSAKGLEILKQNYLDVYIYEEWNAKEILNYEIGETFLPTELTLIKDTPPEQLTEAALITLMEKHGIGTDNTRADHIHTIKLRKYVDLRKNIFAPTWLGLGLVEGYNNIGPAKCLTEPNLRAQFESDLKLICKGEKDPNIVIRNQIERYKEIYKNVETEFSKIIETVRKRLYSNDSLFGNQD